MSALGEAKLIEKSRTLLAFFAIQQQDDRKDSSETEYGERVQWTITAIPLAKRRTNPIYRCGPHWRRR